jgi:hypothetical protein
MRIRVTADNTNGNLPGHTEWFTDPERAKRHADWWHGQSSLRNVQIDVPLGVMVTDVGGREAFEVAPDLATAQEVAASWQAVIDNRKINRTTARKVEILGLPSRAYPVSPEDLLVGGWMAAALDDHKVCPSMKYDINRWLDSKDWK